MSVTVLRDAGLSGLIESDSIDKAAGGFQFTEGPLWQPDGGLLFQDIKAERSYRLALTARLSYSATTREPPTARLLARTVRSSFANKQAGACRESVRPAARPRRLPKPGPAPAQ